MKYAERFQLTLQKLTGRLTYAELTADPVTKKAPKKKK
jgi:hypothetical protein